MPDSPSKFPSLRIEGAGSDPLFHRTKVFLDDRELKALRGLKVEMHIDDVNLATLEMIVGEVRVDHTAMVEFLVRPSLASSTAPELGPEGKSFCGRVLQRFADKVAA